MGSLKDSVALQRSVVECCSFSDLDEKDAMEVLSSGDEGKEATKAE